MGEQIELEDWIAEKMARRKKTMVKKCVACGGSGTNSKGGPCVCQTGPKSLPPTKKKRRAKKKVTASVPKPMPSVEKRRTPKASFSVGFVKRAARSLFTTEIKNAQLGSRVKGSIIRIRASESDTAAELDDFGAFLIEHGATAFKTLSAPKRPDLLGDVSQVSLSPVATPREAVETILEEEDDDELTKVAEDCMSKVGL